MQRYTLAMIATLMPHLRICPYKEGVTIDQIQMPFHAVGRSFSYELLLLYIVFYGKKRKKKDCIKTKQFNMINMSYILISRNVSACWGTKTTKDAVLETKYIITENYRIAGNFRWCKFSQKP